MWKNSLVFHDIDKMISLFIHIYPPIGTPHNGCSGRVDRSAFLTQNVLYL
jgi:hypothetical protein